MKCCNQDMSNFSFYPSHSILDKKTPHFYCLNCGRRFYKNKWYTTDEWFFYINEETFADHQRRIVEGGESTQ